MRMFWRNQAREHAFVLIIEVMGGYEGVGSYGIQNGAAVKLFEEAGGQGRSFITTEQTAQLEIAFDFAQEDFIAGEAQVSSLFADSAELTLSPSSLPIWCNEMN